jgi:hypothetical protein
MWTIQAMAHTVEIVRHILKMMRTMQQIGISKPFSFIKTVVLYMGKYMVYCPWQLYITN